MWLNNKKRKPILVIGDLMLDEYWYSQVQRISPEAPVPISQIQQTKSYPGGAANVAMNLANLDDQVELMGFIGNDAYGTKLTQLVDRENIKSNLIKIENQRTISKLRLIAQHQQLIRIDQDSNFTDFSPQLIDLYKTRLTEVDLVVFSDYHKGTLAQVAEMISLAKAVGKQVLVDPKGKDFSIYSGADLLTPNLNEFQTIVGYCQDDAEIIDKGKQLIKQLKLQALLVTRSEKGMTLITPHHSLHLPAHAKEVYDVTGAGDTVIAVLASCLACKITLEQAVNMANMAAGITVSRLGTGTVTLKDLHKAWLMEQQQSMQYGLVDLVKLKDYAYICKTLGEKLVFTNGCFDLLHVGHIRYLNEAKKLGDRLIVAINSDQSVNKLKGKTRPIISLNERAELLANLKMVDWVITFDTTTPQNLIEDLKPDVLVKGGDYKSIDQIVGSDAVLKYGGEVRLLNFVEDISTTYLIQKIQQSS